MLVLSVLCFKIIIFVLIFFFILWQIKKTLDEKATTGKLPNWAKINGEGEATKGFVFTFKILKRKKEERLRNIKY